MYTPIKVTLIEELEATVSGHPYQGAVFATGFVYLDDGVEMKLRLLRMPSVEVRTGDRVCLRLFKNQPSGMTYYTMEPLSEAT